MAIFEGFTSLKTDLAVANNSRLKASFWEGEPGIILSLDKSLLTVWLIA
jgi:hypothetical protein